MAVADFRDKLLQGLGGPWPEPCDLNARLVETTERPGFTILSISYDAEPNDRVTALLLIPEGVSPQCPAPAVICLHQHKFKEGKNEPAGLEGPAMHHTAAALAREGFVTLCFDALCFGARQGEKLKSFDGERFEFLRYLVDGKCLAWKHILDIKRAVDFLVSRDEVKSEWIGCYGHSMGSTHAWLVGPWEDRLKCFVCNCCLPTYEGIHREEMLHCYPNFIPGVYQYGDMPDIVSLIAPRPLHMNFGELDGDSPIDLVRKGMTTIADVYGSMHAEQNFSHFIEAETGHVFSKQMWRRTLDWFETHLKKS